MEMTHLLLAKVKSFFRWPTQRHNYMPMLVTPSASTALRTCFGRSNFANTNHFDAVTEYWSWCRTHEKCCRQALWALVIMLSRPHILALYGTSDLEFIQECLFTMNCSHDSPDPILRVLMENISSALNMRTQTYLAQQSPVLSEHCLLSNGISLRNCNFNGNMHV